MRNITAIVFVLWANILFGQTYGTYYNSAEGLKENALKTALYDIIKGHTEFPYTSSSTDVWDILKETDKDPNNAANVIFLYSGQTILAGLAGNEYRGGSGWTREHVWPQSLGDFSTSSDLWGATDVHHLRPEDSGVNSTRSNRPFDNCITCVEVWDNGLFTGSYTDANLGTFEPRDAVKGDVARMIFYMATRYEGENGESDLELLDASSFSAPNMGQLSTLIEWNREDPVDEWERNRNEIIFSYQNNRNPFIDFPDLVEYIWGNAAGLTWSSTFSTFPKDGETDVAINTTIKYVFGEAIRNIGGAEITNDNVSNLLSLNVSNASGNAIAFTATIDVNKKVITLTPEAELIYNQVYYASIEAVEDDNGNANSFTEISFTTIEQDITTPTFLSSPVYGATGVNIFTNIKVTFDESIRFLDDSEITDSTVASLLTLKENDENGTDVAFSAIIDINKKLITATPATNLKSDQLYYATIGSVEDASNNATAYSSMTFTTAQASESSGVIISQYYEGAGNDKYIEITNAGNIDVDLNTYYLGRFSNTDSPLDAAIYSNGSALSGTIAAGQTLVYKNASAVNPSYAVNNSIASTTATYFNGNDPIALMNGGNTWGNRVDCIYASGTWGAERSFYRKADIMSGNRFISVLDGTGEWTEVSLAIVASASSAVSENLGVHFFTDISLEIDPLLNPKINIYPNPSKGKFYIELGNTFNANAKIEVFNMVGMKVYQTRARESKTALDLSSMKQGVYYVRVDDGKNVLTQKIIKQ